MKEKQVLIQDVRFGEDYIILIARKAGGKTFRKKFAFLLKKKDVIFHKEFIKLNIPAKGCFIVKTYPMLANHPSCSSTMYLLRMYFRELGGFQIFKVAQFAEVGKDEDAISAVREAYLLENL